MYNETRYSRGIVEFLDDLLFIPRLANPEVGDTAFCKENARVMTWDGDLWMCDDFIKMRNLSGSSLDVGDLVVHSTTSGSEPAITTTLIGQNELIVGPVIFPSTSGNWAAIAYKGIYRVKVFQFESVGPVLAGDFFYSGFVLTTSGNNVGSTGNLGKGSLFSPDTLSEYIQGAIGFSAVDGSPVLGDNSGGSTYTTTLKCLIKQNVSFR